MKLPINPDQKINFISLLQVVSSFGEHLRKKSFVDFSIFGHNQDSENSSIYWYGNSFFITLYFSEMFLLDFFKKAKTIFLFAVLPFSQGFVHFLFHLWVKSESKLNF